MTTELRSTALVVGSEAPANDAELRSTLLVVGSEAPANDAELRAMALVVGSEVVTPPDPLIDVRGSSTAGQASAVTTHPIAVPAGTQDDDQLIALFATRTAGPSHTGPGGWTQLAEYADTSWCRTSVWQRTASSEPASYDWVTDAADPSAGFMLALSDAAGESAVSAATEDSDANPDSSLLTVSDSDDGGWLWLSVGAWVTGDATVSAYPSTLTLSTGTIASGGGVAAGWAATANHETAVNPPGWTLSESELWVMFTLAVRGLAAAPTPSGTLTQALGNRRRRISTTEAFGS